MIPKEKIEQAALEYAKKKCKGMEGAALIVRRIASEDDFTEGIWFAESELKSIAIEFAEWLALNGKPTSNSGDLKYWKFGSYQSGEFYTTSELFAKFMAERSEQ